MPRRANVGSLRRARPSRTVKKAVLIVCEGSKTEPNYFGFFKRKFRLQNISIDIFGKECGTDPLSVVRYGSDRFIADSSFDMCFCVIDRDSHDDHNFAKAKDLADKTDKKVNDREFAICLSDPCIEYWFLLHFVYSRAPFVRQGDKSRAQCAVDEIGKYIEGGYQKNCAEIGQILEGLLPTAMQNAEHAYRDMTSTGESNPSTQMHLLMERLQSLLAKP